MRDVRVTYTCDMPHCRTSHRERDINVSRVRINISSVGGMKFSFIINLIYKNKLAKDGKNMEGKKNQRLDTSSDAKMSQPKYPHVSFECYECNALSHQKFMEIFFIEWIVDDSDYDSM